MRKVFLTLSISLLFTFNVLAQNCPLPPKAQYHWDKAIAESKSDDKCQSVINHFEMALEYAPNCSDIYYNLAVHYYLISLKQEGTSALNKAEKHIKSYLKMKPNDKEAKSLL